MARGAAGVGAGPEHAIARPVAAAGTGTGEIRHASGRVLVPTDSSPAMYLLSLAMERRDTGPERDLGGAGGRTDAGGGGVNRGGAGAGALHRDAGNDGCAEPE